MNRTAAAWLSLAAASPTVAACRGDRPAASARPAPPLDAPSPPAPPTDAAHQPRPTPPLDAAPTAVDWHTAYDFDGDGRNDRIVVQFSGGAHCCYHVGVELSTSGKTVMSPFELDGGYVLGLDLSEPDRFTIRTRAGGAPEIVAEIATYNGEPRPLDRSWTRRWGIRTHHVTLCFATGKLQPHDDSPTAPTCH